MPTSTITINGSPVTLVELPAYPGIRTVDFTINETSAVSKGVFTGQTQTHPFPGADWLSGAFSLPQLTQDQADIWIAALMQLRGMRNAFMLGDPLRPRPRGTIHTAPVADGAGNVAMSSSISVRGLEASKYGVLLPGDYVQIGYRLHRVLDRINTDATGKAVIPIFPTLRETVADGTVLNLNNPKGLFRLSQNANKWSSDYTRTSAISVNFTEYR